MPKESPPNVLLIVSDQHNPDIAGYAGNPHVETPNLDRIARRGTNFRNACCNCPVCGPSRMSYMTGKYVHQIQTWWNRVPLDPTEMTWARKLDQNGIESTLLGKIDAPGEYENPGFSRYKLSMRRPEFDSYPRREPMAKMTAGATRDRSRHYLENAGSFDPETTKNTGHGYHKNHGLYFQDKKVLDWTREFIREKGVSESTDPWVAHVGFEYPHWPYVCSDRFFEMYYPDNVQLPHRAAFPENEKLPPALKEWQRWNDFGDVPEETLRRTLAAYYGMVTCMDEMIGEIIEELETQGLFENTIIIYTSDHGESLGEHGLFFKHSPAAAAVGVPLIMSGPGVPSGGEIRSPVSLVDLYPTILQCYGLEVEADRPGENLMNAASGSSGRKDGVEDSVFAEWHGPGFEGAWYMLMNDAYKYTWFESFPPTLYNIADDPHEDHNLGQKPEYAEVLNDFEGELRSRINPEEVSRKAKRDLGVITPGGRDLSKSIDG